MLIRQVFLSETERLFIPSCTGN